MSKHTAGMERLTKIPMSKSMLTSGKFNYTYPNKVSKAVGVPTNKWIAESKRVPKAEMVDKLRTGDDFTPRKTVVCTGDYIGMSKHTGGKKTKIPMSMSMHRSGKFNYTYPNKVSKAVGVPEILEYSRIGDDMTPSSSDKEFLYLEQISSEAETSPSTETLVEKENIKQMLESTSCPKATGFTDSDSQHQDLELKEISKDQESAEGVPVYNSVTDMLYMEPKAMLESENCQSNTLNKAEDPNQQYTCGTVSQLAKELEESSELLMDLAQETEIDDQSQHVQPNTPLIEDEDLEENAEDANPAGRFTRISQQQQSQLRGLAKEHDDASQALLNLANKMNSAFNDACGPKGERLKWPLSYERTGIILGGILALLIVVVVYVTVLCPAPVEKPKPTWWEFISFK